MQNGQIDTANANNILAALSRGDASQVKNALDIISQLVANGQLSTADANNIINALISGDGSAIENATAIIEKLTANGTLASEDAQKIITALNTSAKGNTDIVSTYGKDFSDKVTTVNTTLTGIKSSVDSILTKLGVQADKQITSPSTTPASQTPSTTPTTPSKTPSTPSTNPSTTPTNTKPKAKTKKEKYGVALAIINGNYGWGTGDTRKKRLKAKGFDATEVQNIVNKLLKEGYVNSGAWIGKYEGIKSLTPYHYNKFAQGKKNIPQNQLAITQEKGVEYINSPTVGLLTPLTQGSDVFNADASNNLWKMANTPSEFIKDNLDLGNNFSTPIVQNAIKDTFTGDMNVNISLPNVTNWEQFKYQLQHDPSIEKMFKSMTIDRLFKGNSLNKYKY